MYGSSLILLPNIIRTAQYQIQRNFHASEIRTFYQEVKWRKEKGLPKNHNSFGPLTNLPDYSFKDGRPVPFGTNQKKRFDEQKLKLQKIKQYVGEIDYAVERYERIMQDKIKQRQILLESKLKPKGDLLIESSKDNKDLKAEKVN